MEEVAKYKRLKISAGEEKKFRIAPVSQGSKGAAFKIGVSTDAHGRANLGIGGRHEFYVHISSDGIAISTRLENASFQKSNAMSTELIQACDFVQLVVRNNFKKGQAALFLS